MTERGRREVRHWDGAAQGSAGLTDSGGVQETTHHGPLCSDLIDKVVFGQMLDSVTLEVFSHLNDSMPLNEWDVFSGLNTAFHI